MSNKKDLKCPACGKKAGLKKSLDNDKVVSVRCTHCEFVWKPSMNSGVLLTMAASHNKKRSSFYGGAPSFAVKGLRLEDDEGRTPGEA